MAQICTESYALLLKPLLGTPWYIYHPMGPYGTFFYDKENCFSWEAEKELPPEFCNNHPRPGELVVATNARAGSTYEDIKTAYAARIPTDFKDYHDDVYGIPSGPGSYVWKYLSEPIRSGKYPREKKAITGGKNRCDSFVIIQPTERQPRKKLRTKNKKIGIYRHKPGKTKRINENHAVRTLGILRIIYGTNYHILLENWNNTIWALRAFWQRQVPTKFVLIDGSDDRIFGHQVQIRKQISKALIKTKKFNVVTVMLDFSKSHMKEATDTLANFILKLLEDRVILCYDHIHLIGISVAAHLGGHIGKKIFKITGQKVGRITGISPYGKPFLPDTFFKLDYKYSTSISHVLSKDDANFVDIIMTAPGFVIQRMNKNGTRPWDLLYDTCISFEFPNLHAHVLYISKFYSLDFIKFYEEHLTKKGNCKSLPITSEDFFHTPGNQRLEAVYLYINSMTQSNLAKKCYHKHYFLMSTCDDSNTVIVGELVDESRHGVYYIGNDKSSKRLRLSVDTQNQYDYENCKFLAE